MEYYKKLSGKHIYLSPISLDDVNQYFDWVTSNDISNQAVFEGYKTTIIGLPEAKKELENMAANNAFAIIEEETNRLLGYCGINDIANLNQRAEIWIKIDPSIDRQKQVDLGVEALEKLIDYAHNYLNLNNLMMKVSAFNSGLIDIATKSNMMFLGNRTTSSRFIDNTYYDTLYFQITRDKNKSGETVTNFSSDGVDLNLSDQGERTVISGERVTLIKYRRKNKYDKLLAEYLNVKDNSLPLGEFKRNFNLEFSRRFLADTDYLILVDNRFIGYIKTIVKDEFNRTAGLEILIGDSMYKGKGYGSESLDLFLNEVFSKRKYSNIMSSIFAFNEISERMHQKLGFTYVGTREQAYYSEGHFNDMHYYEMTEEQYNKRQK